MTFSNSESNKIKYYFFTLNNIRGFRRFISLKKGLKKYNYGLKLITSSFSTYIIAKLFLVEVLFLMNKENLNFINSYLKISNYKEDLLISSVKAEVNQEFNYSIISKKLFIHSKIFKSLYSYINSCRFLKTKNKIPILGFNSNIINQISICSAAEETNNNFFSIVPIDPPSIVGITKGFPYLRQIIFDKSAETTNLNFDNKIIINKKGIKKYKLTTYAYLNKYEALIRKMFSRFLLHVDDIYNLLFYLFNNNRDIQNKVNYLYQKLELHLKQDDIENWITNLSKEDISFKKNISFFEGNINRNKRYHVFYCSSPLESHNYFPGTRNEYEILLKLSKQFQDCPNNIFVARLHPGFEHKYSKIQLYDLSNNGVKIWDKRKCINFKLGNDSNIIKYTTLGTIFLESLGTKSPCLITSDALNSCKDYIKQPSPFNLEKAEINTTPQKKILFSEEFKKEGYLK